MGRVRNLEAPPSARAARDVTRRALAACGFAVVALVGAGACSSSSGKSTPAQATTSTSAPASTIARIDSFVVPPTVPCTKSETKTNVSISYAVSGAASRQIVVDGLTEPALTAAHGTVSEAVHCDGVLHTVALIAVDAGGRRVSKVKNFSTVIGTGS